MFPRNDLFSSLEVFIEEELPSNNSVTLLVRLVLFLFRSRHHPAWMTPLHLKGRVDQLFGSAGEDNTIRSPRVVAAGVTPQCAGEL